MFHVEQGLSPQYPVWFGYGSKTSACSSLRRLALQNRTRIEDDLKRPNLPRVDVTTGTNVLPRDPERGTNTCSSKKALFTLDFRRIDRRSLRYASAPCRGFP